MTDVQQRVRLGRQLRAVDPRGRRHLRAAGIWLAVLLAAAVAHAQQAPNETRRGGCQVAGHVTASGRPLPGVALVLSSPSGVELAASSTAVDGAYRLVPPAPGTYVLHASLAGFADVARDVALTAENCEGSADLEMVLRSRTAPAGGAPHAAPSPAPPAGAQERRPGAAHDRRAATPGGRFRDLGVMAGAAAGTQVELAAEGADASLQSLLPPGFSADAPTEAVAMRGGPVQTLDGVLFRDRLALLDEVGGDLDGLAQRMRQGMAAGGMGPPPDFPGGGPGGPGASFGGGEFRGGPGPGVGGGGFRGGAGGFGRSDRLQGSIFYSLGDSAFDASPYALTGSRQKAAYAQQAALCDRPG